ncbi:MAG: radical SAM protein [Elusimicrobiales bacterium]
MAEKTNTDVKDVSRSKQSVQSQKDPKRLTLQLIVTEGCNLSCAYCFEHSKNSTFMDFDTAMNAVRYYLSGNAELDGEPAYDEVMIDFMGGEPMLAFPMIQRIVAAVICPHNNWGKNYGFSMSTNGTLFTEENKAWFLKHKQLITPMLSFDGTKTAHDMNRSQSYDVVVANVDFLNKHWPKQKFKMTVDNRSLPYIADGLFEILKRGCGVSLNLVHDDVWGDGEQKQKHLKTFETELARIVTFYSKNSAIELPNLISLPIQNCLFKDVDRPKAWCGAGNGMVAIGVDGVKYPCHRFIKFSAGKSVPLEEFRAWKRKPAENGLCENCKMLPACPTCQGGNWERYGNPDKRITHNCEMLKLQMVATAAVLVTLKTSVDF